MSARKGSGAAPAATCRCGCHRERLGRSPAWPGRSRLALAPLDLSLPQYRVLALLGDGSTASSVLARRLAVSPPTRHRGGRRPRRPGPGRAPGRPRGPPPAHAAAHPRRRQAPRAPPMPRPRRASARSRSYLEDPSSATAAIEALSSGTSRSTAIREETRQQASDRSRSTQRAAAHRARSAPTSRRRSSPSASPPRYPPPRDEHRRRPKSSSWIRRMMPIVARAQVDVRALAGRRRSSASSSRCRSPTRSARRSTTAWARTAATPLEHFVDHHRGARG